MTQAQGNSLKAFYCDPAKISVLPDRHRKHFDQKALEDLAGSIKDNGQIEPIIIDGDYNLIAGERRLRACRDILNKEILCLFRADITDEILKQEIELEENLRREDLTPQEEVLAHEKLHNLKQQKHGEKASGKSSGGWGLGDTAESLGKTKSSLSRDLKLAQALKIMPELQQAKTKAEMQKILNNSVKKAEWVIKAAEVEKASMKERKENRVLTIEDIKEKAYKRFSEGLREGSFMEEFPKTDLKPNIVIADPPWGVNLDEKIEGTRKVDRSSYQDSKAEFERGFPDFCNLLFERMGEDSHLYLFFGITHFTFVYNCLEEAGFQVNRRPILWIKPGAHSTRVPDIWPGASYEPIAFARKGQRKLVQMKGDSIVLSGLTPTEKGGHPSAKPHQLYMDLLSRSAHPGDLIMDPMFGTGPCFLACEYLPELHLRWVGWEIDRKYRSVALVKLVEHIGGEKK